jgi:diguanylate cyclase (GGDEF)-like protein
MSIQYSSTPIAGRSNTYHGKRSSSMKLQAQLRLGALVLLVLALGASAFAFFGSFQAYRQSTRDLQAMLCFDLAREASSAVSAERGPSNILLSRGPTAASGPTYERLRIARARTDLALDRLDRLLENRPLMAATARNGMSSVRAAIDQGRAIMDGATKVPLENRSSADVQASIDWMVEARIKLDPFVQDLASRAAHEASSQADAILMAEILNELREYGGRIGSMLMVPLFEPTPISSSRRLTIEYLRGRIDQLHRLINRHLVSEGEIERAQSRVEQGYFGHALPLIDRLTSRPGNDFGLTASSFTEQVVPDLQGIEVLGDLFVRQAIAEVTKAKAHARDKMILLGVCLFGFLCFLVVMLRGADRFIARPLFHARQEIIDLAHGKRTSKRQRAGHSAEMLALYEALDVLKEHHHQSELVAKERDELSRGLHRMAYTDALTGLRNRRALDEMVGDVSSASMLSVEHQGLILIDIDHFKAINDQYGHVVGDIVLREVARRIRSIVTSSQQAFRYGGEEFAVLTTGLPIEDVCAIAECIRQALSTDAVRVPVGVDLSVTASLGVALRNETISTWFDLLSAADFALYRAKASGRNRLILAPTTVYRPRQP